jgi:hypothetical protein
MRDPHPVILYSLRRFNENQVANGWDARAITTVRIRFWNKNWHDQRNGAKLLFQLQLALPFLRGHALLQ